MRACGTLLACLALYALNTLRPLRASLTLYALLALRALFALRPFRPYWKRGRSLDPSVCVVDDGKLTIQHVHSEMGVAALLSGKVEHLTIRVDRFGRWCGDTCESVTITEDGHHVLENSIEHLASYLSLVVLPNLLID